MSERPHGPLLSNPRSDRIRALRALAGRSVRNRAGRFLIEGPQAAREAVRSRLAHELLMTNEARQRYREIWQAARDSDISAQIATPEVISTISKDAQGVVAVAEMFDAQLEPVLAQRPQLLVVLEQNQDPGNAGTIIRTADAAGADAVIMARGSVDIFNPKVVRASAGSLFHLPVITGRELPDILDAIREAKLQVLAADGGGSHDLDAVQDAAEADAHGERGPDLRKPSAWLFGNEARGLAPADLSRADFVISIPIHGQAESLNLASAAALCLYASARAQRAHARPTQGIN